jgi:transcriptional regulator with XRE-family HTH domain
MTLGEKIKTIRTIKGYSQEFIAEKMGISTSTFSKIERNEIIANWTRMNEIASVLDISIADLVTFGDNNVINVSGGTNNGFMGNIVMNTSNDIPTLLQRIDQLEKEIILIKSQIEVR